MLVQVYDGREGMVRNREGMVRNREVMVHVREGMVHVMVQELVLDKELVGLAQVLVELLI